MNPSRLPSPARVLPLDGPDLRPAEGANRGDFEPRWMRWILADAPYSTPLTSIASIDGRTCARTLGVRCPPTIAVFTRLGVDLDDVSPTATVSDVCEGFGLDPAEVLGWLWAATTERSWTTRGPRL